MKVLYKLFRIKHYIKNFLIFVPFLFGSMFSLIDIKNIIIAFFAFSFMASCIYIINDIKDIERDKKHPVKKNRPIASGKVSIKLAKIIAIFMFIGAFILNYICSSNPLSYVWLLIYFLLNLLYSFKLKRIPIFDIVCLVSFYIIRIYYGGAVVGVPVSNWLYLALMSLAAFLAFGKRRNELQKNGEESRTVLKFYNQEFLDKFMYVSLALAINFYSLWAIEHAKQYFEYTIPIVFIILMRYSLIIEGESDGDPVEVVFKDRTLTIFGIIYAVITCALI